MRTICSLRYQQRYSLLESSAKFNVRIYKSLNHNELCVKRKNNDDVDSMDGENDEDLTYLTCVYTKMWEVVAKLREESEMGRAVEKEKMG